MNGRISHTEAIRIIRTQGWSPDQPTETKAGRWVQGTDFHSMLGVKATYSRQAILAWLGY